MCHFCVYHILNINEVTLLNTLKCEVPALLSISPQSLRLLF